MMVKKIQKRDLRKEDRQTRTAQIRGEKKRKTTNKMTVFKMNPPCVTV